VNAADYQHELEAASAAGRAAGEVVMTFFKSVYDVRDKGGMQGEENPVTSADLAANAVLKERLLGAFPDDGWLSEETVDSRERLSRRRVWVVDPIDGTKEFILGLPQFSISIGLTVGGRAVVGVIVNPARDEVITGAPGLGAMLNGVAQRPTETADLTRAVCLASRTECEKGWFDRYTNEGTLARVEPIGSVAYKLALVAIGRGDLSFSLTPKNEWDLAGGAAILSAAGLSLTDRDGAPITYNRPDTAVAGCVTANARLMPALQDLIARERARYWAEKAEGRVP
jgi:myo-inositol-1(or 4)-monophosphatase